MVRYDLTGERFGRLLVVCKDHIDRVKRGTVVYWLCLCDCGNTAVVRTGSLRSGNTQSCGCLQKDNASEANRIYDHTKQGDRLRSIWYGMRNRCYNETCDSFEYYGARGIRICDEWLDFDKFYEWAINNGYSDNLTIHRVDNNAGYCPQNCIWATQKEQANNYSRNIFVTFQNETHTVKEWSEKLGMSYHALLSRIKRGWDIERALTEEVRS